MSQRRVTHWELGVLLEVGILGYWLAEPQFWPAAAAGLLAVATVVAAVRTLRPGPVVVAAVALLAVIAALDSSGRTRMVETDWAHVRTRLVARANGELGGALDQAVHDAVELAIAGAASARDRREAFRHLEQAVGKSVPERGVVVFAPDRRPLAWAGRHRLAVAPEPGPDLMVRITPFYVVLEARRQAADGRIAVAHVLLAADIAVPDRDRSLAVSFGERVGAGLEFFAPRRPPPPGAFWYCVPACDAMPADTLFSVRATPPAQGTYKLVLLEAGARWTTILAFLSLALLTAFARSVGRWGALPVAVGLLMFTPAGGNLGFDYLFSSATYFLGALGPMTASAGALLVGAAAGLIALFWGAGRRALRLRAARSAGVALALLTPFWAAYLAQGITPPADAVTIVLWLKWQVALTLAGAVLLVAAAVLRGGGGPRSSSAGWVWAPAAGAVGLAALGVLLWRPGAGWPDWFVLTWLPVAWAASRPAPPLQTAVRAALVAGVGAALLTWATAIQGRLLLAERDLDRLAGGDPVAIGMLDQFVRELGGRSPPRDAAALYALWRESALGRDDYPAVLASWEGGRQVARLELAELGMSEAFLGAYAANALQRGEPLTLATEVEPGLRYVGAVPVSQGVVVTVAVAPRSQLIPPVLVGRFLRGERRLRAPYQMSLGEVLGPTAERATTEWRRMDWSLRGTRTVRAGSLARHVHVQVDLGEPAQIAIRGALVVVLDVLVVLLLWVLGEALGGRGAARRELREWLRFRSYRSRLAVALAGFFVLPTVGFAAWSVSRLRLGALQTRDLVIQQTLRDAAATAREFIELHDAQRKTRLGELASRLNADLLWYESGRLEVATAAVLEQLGLVERHLPPRVFQQLILEDEFEVTDEALIGGHPTRVGYRSIGGPGHEVPVLASPRLVDVTGLQREQEDVAFGLLLVTLLGLGGAVGLADFAARTLARPVQSLRMAAEAVGRGDRVPPFDRRVPTEFASVIEAFQRMAADVEASQRALDAARRRTAAVLARVATGVVAVDPVQRVVLANPRAEELFGVLLQPGTTLRDHTGPQWAALWDWVAEFMARGGELDAMEFGVADRVIRVQAAALGDPPGCVVALDDTTELTQAVRVLAWGDLARQIAHEIKNPLTPIRLGVQHLQRARRHGNADFDSTLERTARQILAEIERLDAIARAFARFGAPPPTQEPLERADLVGIARDAAALYALSSAAVQVEHDGPVEALVRKDEVKEVLINLIENARDAGAGRIAIRVRRRDGFALVEVEDDGRGISREHLARIFEPHFSTTTSGTGLGLAICRRLVESWGGTIEVESEEARGTRVVIRLVTGDEG